MKKYIPLELSLAQRLAAAEPETRFCDFCRTEQAAVEELKEVMAKPAAELLFSPSLAYLAHLEELRKKQGFGIADVCDPLDKAVLSAQMPGPAPAEDGPNRQMEAYSRAAARPGDYRTDGDGIWLRKGFLHNILLHTGLSLGEGGTVKLVDLPEAAQKLRDELDQAQATIKEMGGLIDQQAAELERLKQNVNYMVEGCTCNRAQGIPAEAVNEIRGSV